MERVHTLTDDIMTVDAYFGQFLDQSFRLIQAAQVDYRWHVGTCISQLESSQHEVEK